MVDLTVTFIVVSDLFERYTILVNTASKNTSVFCEECEMWVADYDGNVISTYMPSELLGVIVEDHRHQVNGVPVEVLEESESTIVE